MEYVYPSFADSVALFSKNKSRKYDKEFNSENKNGRYDSRVRI